MITEDDVWSIVDPEDLWALDKLILSRKLGYKCGPIGYDVKIPGWYIVRPCVNMMGLGLGTSKTWLDDDTTHLPIGSFWCEFFEGRHISVDYIDGKQVLAVEGTKSNDTFTRWEKWTRVEDVVPMPGILQDLSDRYKTINCEFIGKNLIEVHLRGNPDFNEDISEFIPVWDLKKDLTTEGYRFVHCPEYHGRIGAWVK